MNVDVGIAEMRFMMAGFERLDATEVWTDGTQVVVFGDLSDEDDRPEKGLGVHNCDHMGCGSVGPHVILLAALWRRGDK